MLSACAAYLGNDSGISHLAAALGIPALALFGPTDAAVWGPRGEHAAVLCAPAGDLAALEVEAVVEALARLRK